MIAISIETISLAPGFAREKKQLLRLLNRAAVLSEMLHLQINDDPFASQLIRISRQLEEMTADH